MSLYIREPQSRRIGRTVGLIAPIVTVLIIAAVVAVILLRPASDYAAAKRALDSGDFVGAYLAFVDLGDYSDSKRMADKADEMAYKAVLDGEMSILDYESIFSLKPEQYPLVYSTAIEHMNTLQYDSINPNWQHSQSLIECLPDNYENCAVYKKLFDYLNAGDVICETDIKFIKDNWSIPYIQSIVLHRDESKFFLEGEWKTADGKKHFTLIRNAKGVFNANYTLPLPETPAPTVGYSVNGNIFTMYDAYGSPMGTAFTFAVVDFDHIKVNCLADDTTYILTRQ